MHQHRPQWSSENIASKRGADWGPFARTTTQSITSCWWCNILSKVFCVFNWAGFEKSLTSSHKILFVPAVDSWIRGGKHDRFNGKRLPDNRYSPPQKQGGKRRGKETGLFTSSIFSLTLILSESAGRPTIYFIWTAKWKKNTFRTDTISSNMTNTKCFGVQYLPLSAEMVHKV